MMIAVASSLLFIALAIPLMLRRVPPNAWYGLRVAATFEDDSVWYEANARSGRDLLLLGTSLLVLALLMPVVPVSEATYLLFWSSVTLAGCVLLAVAGWRRANRLLRERRG